MGTVLGNRRQNKSLLRRSIKGMFFMMRSQSWTVFLDQICSNRRQKNKKDFAVEVLFFRNLLFQGRSQLREYHLVFFPRYARYSRNPSQDIDLLDLF